MAEGADWPTMKQCNQDDRVGRCFFSKAVALQLFSSALSPSSGGRAWAQASQSCVHDCHTAQRESCMRSGNDSHPP